MERHFTVTSYILKENKTLLIFHPKLLKWLPPGGHIEPNETPPEAAKREALEETGVEIELLSQENIWIEAWNASSFPRPYFCLLENIPPHKDKPAHQHIDLVYLACPIGGSERKDLLQQGLMKWFTLEEIQSFTGEEFIFEETKQAIRHIFSQKITSIVLN